MKVRGGFVSNSSSTSFCVFGVVIKDIGDIEELIYSDKNRIAETKLDVTYGVSDYYEQTLIGVEPRNIKEDETFSQFRERVANAIADLTNKEVSTIKPAYHIDGGRDG